MTYGEQPAEWADEPAGEWTDEQAAPDAADDMPADPAPAPEDSGTADPRVAGALAQLEGLADTPPDAHVEVYEQVHRVLHDALTDAAGGSEQSHQGGPRP